MLETVLDTFQDEEKDMFSEIDREGNASLPRCIWLQEKMERRKKRVLVDDKGIVTGKICPFTMGNPIRRGEK